MNKGKVVIIGGNKRAGKTTLAMKLHNEYNYNYYNYDMLLDSLEASFPYLSDSNDDKYIKLLEEMVKRSLEDAENYGVSTIYEYIFSPRQLSKFKYKENVQIYFLANLDAREDNIREDFKKYSNSFDWSAYESTANIERNVKYILEHNDLLVKECNEYDFELVNTSREENRDKVISELAKRINSY